MSAGPVRRLDVGLDLEYDDGQLAIRDALDQFCADRCDDSVVKSLVGRFPGELWRELCGLGVLEPAAESGDGGALEIAAAFEALGRWVVPGPWCANVLAARLLSGGELASLLSGDLVVSLGRPPLWPWLDAAGLFIAIDGDSLRRARLVGEPEPVETLGGESWGRCAAELEGVEGPFEAAEAARVLHDVAHAAYLSAAAEKLLEETAEYARNRVQFGRSIGEFQAVAHPLADCSMRIAAAASLARAAAWFADQGLPEAAMRAAGARLSANRAALDTAHACHQAFGAVGITLEGPVYHRSRRIRQMASDAPGNGPAQARLWNDVERMIDAGAVEETQ